MVKAKEERGRGESGRKRKREREREKGTRQELRNGENKKANYLAVTYPRGEVSI